VPTGFGTPARETRALATITDYLFSPLGSKMMDALFFVPGTNTPTSVFGFGDVFTDVDLANTSSLEFFNLANASLATFFVPTFNNGLSFLGVTFTDAIGRVRIMHRQHRAVRMTGQPPT
jgi:hypothetical protein